MKDLQGTRPGPARVSTPLPLHSLCHRPFPPARPHHPPPTPNPSQRAPIIRTPRLLPSHRPKPNPPANKECLRCRVTFAGGTYLFTYTPPPTPPPPHPPPPPTTPPPPPPSPLSPHPHDAPQPLLPRPANCGPPPHAL